MTPQISIVIGANFGDEGKGLLTDALCVQARGSTLVIRFNGGAQAGHTVKTASGLRHVFSHFSSGSFQGADTFLSANFWCDPILFLAEHQTLQAMGCQPRVWVDPSARFVTPYDVILNRAVERMRGKQRHGSCGKGIGEAFARSAHPSWTLTVAQAKSSAQLKKTLLDIRQHWVPKRVQALQLETQLSAEERHLLSCDALWQRFIQQSEAFLEKVEISPLGALSDHYAHWIFEGAQGLLLSQDHAYFPHVTPSYTGLKGVLPILEAAQFSAMPISIPMDVYYVSRAYLTRHGAGPLPHELPHKPYDRVIDETNQTNLSQGPLRFAYFDLDLFHATLRAEHQKAKDLPTVRHHVCITCLDQVEETMFYWHQGRCKRTKPEAFLKTLHNLVQPHSMRISHGPTAQDISIY